LRLAIVKYRIDSISEPAPGTKVFRMVPADGAMMKFTPGQFVFLHILDKEGNTIVKKPYSIASAPDAKYLEFCIKMRNGNCTGRLADMAVGESVGIEGPLGNFTYDGQKEAGFVAGGVGIAPFLSILRYIADKNLKGKFILFYSAKTKGDLIYHDELVALEKKNSGIKVVMTLTRETPDGWRGECGRLNDCMIKKHAGELTGMGWWICGPLDMVSAIKKCLVESGKDQKDIRMEGWG